MYVPCIKSSINQVYSTLIDSEVVYDDLFIYRSQTKTTISYSLLSSLLSSLSLSLQTPSATVFGWVAEGILLAKMKMFLVPIFLLALALSFYFAAARLPDSEGIYIYMLTIQMHDL